MDKVINPEDSKYYDNLYSVGLYPGAGAELITFDVYANNEQQAIELVVAEVELTKPGLLYDFDSIRDYVYTTYEDEYKEWLEDKSGEEYSYGDSWFEFAQEYLGYVYVDATEYGATQPYFIEGNNIQISEINTESNSVDKKEELFNVNIDTGDILSGNNANLDLGGAGALLGMLASEEPKECDNKLEETELDKDKVVNMKDDELPNTCYGVLPSDNSIIILTKGENGYRKASFHGTPSSKEDAEDLVNHLNAKRGITPEQRLAMEVRSMSGNWEQKNEVDKKVETASDVEDYGPYYVKEFNESGTDMDTLGFDSEQEAISYAEDSIKKNPKYEYAVYETATDECLYVYDKSFFKENKSKKEEYYQMSDDEHIIWDSEDSIDDYDIDEMKELYQDYLDEFDSEMKPMTYEDWLYSEECSDYFYNEWEDAAKENPSYAEFYDFITKYVDDEEKEDAYNEYVEQCKNTTLQSDDFETWFDNYRIDHEDAVWNWKEEDLQDNIFPNIDNQLNDNVLLLSGSYGSNYPDFRSSGDGGVMWENGTEDFRQYMSGFDRVCITTQNGILGAICNDHDGTVSGQFYTLPNDKTELIKAMGYEDIIKERYDEEDLDKYNEEDLMETEFNNDLYYGGIDAGDLNAHIDLLVPVKDTITSYGSQEPNPNETKTESKKLDEKFMEFSTEQEKDDYIKDNNLQKDIDYKDKGPTAIELLNENKEIKTENKEWLSQDNKAEYLNDVIWAELDIDPDYIEIDYENEDTDAEWLDKVHKAVQTKADDYNVEVANIVIAPNGYTVILNGTLQNIVDFIYDQKNYSIDKCIDEMDIMVSREPLNESKTIKTETKYAVEYRLSDTQEVVRSKPYDSFIDAMKYQGEIIKKMKDKIDYCKYVDLDESKEMKTEVKSVAEEIAKVHGVMGDVDKNIPFTALTRKQQYDKIFAYLTEAEYQFCIDFGKDATQGKASLEDAVDMFDITENELRELLEDYPEKEQEINNAIEQFEKAKNEVISACEDKTVLESKEVKTEGYTSDELKDMLNKDEILKVGQTKFMLEDGKVLYYDPSFTNTWDFHPNIKSVDDLVKHLINMQEQNYKVVVEPKDVKEKTLVEMHDILKNTNVQQWYMDTFPTDELGKEINSSINFYDVFDALDTYKDIYALLNVNDSVVRERVFNELDEMLDEPTGYSYEQWKLGTKTESKEIKTESTKSDKDKYLAYEKVRRSGVTNMFDLRTVSALSGLSYDDIKYVMSNYEDLATKYGDDTLEESLLSQDEYNKIAQDVAKGNAVKGNDMDKFLHDTEEIKINEIKAKYNLDEQEASDLEEAISYYGYLSNEGVIFTTIDSLMDCFTDMDENKIENVTENTKKAFAEYIIEADKIYVSMWDNEAVDRAKEILQESKRIMTEDNKNVIPRDWKKITYKSKIDTNMDNVGDVIEIERDKWDTPIAKNTRTGKTAYNNWDIVRNSDLAEIIDIERKQESKETITERMNGLRSENSVAEQLFDDFREMEDIDTEAWNNGTKEQRIAMVKPKVEQFYNENKETILDNLDDFMELLEYWNYHTEYGLFLDILKSNKYESKQIKTEADENTNGRATIDLHTDSLPIINMFQYNIYQSDIVGLNRDEVDEIQLEFAKPLITNQIKGVLPSADITFGDFNHPQYYKLFSNLNDTLDFTVSYDIAEYEALKEKALQDPGFETYLKEHYSSYDGFMSFMANNIQDFNEQEDWKQWVSVVSYYLPNDDEQNYDDMLMYVNEKLLETHDTFDSAVDNMIGQVKENGIALNKDAITDYIKNYYNDIDEYEVEDIIDTVLSELNVNESKKVEDVEYITQKELDDMPDDYKTTVKDTIDTAEFRGEDIEQTRKLYKDLGYDENDPMILSHDDKLGTVLKPVKIKNESTTNKDICVDEENGLNDNLDENKAIDEGILGQSNAELDAVKQDSIEKGLYTEESRIKEENKEVVTENCKLENRKFKK